MRRDVSCAHPLDSPNPQVREPRRAVIDLSLPSSKKRAGSAPPGSGPMSSYVTRIVTDVEQVAIDAALVRMIASNALPKRIVIAPTFLRLLSTLRPTYVAPTTRKLEDLIELEFNVAFKDVERLVSDDQYGITLMCDGWSTMTMQSVVSSNLVLSNRQSVLWSTEDLSGMSHTGENMAEHIMQTILAVEMDRAGQRGPFKIVMLTTDNAANMKKARQLVVSTPGFGHIVEFR